MQKGFLGGVKDLFQSHSKGLYNNESVIPGVPPEEKWIRGTPGIFLFLKEKSRNFNEDVETIDSFEFEN